MSLEKGITRFKHIIQKDKRVTVMEPVSQKDPLFYIALKEWLIRHGFKAAERHPEVDDEVKSLSDYIPDKHPLKIKIMSELPKMSYLEKTFILEQLRKEFVYGTAQSE